MYNPILSILSLYNYEKVMLKYPADQKEEQLVKEISKQVRTSLWQIVIALISICAAYVFSQLI